jgi:hypothetical protein
MMRGQAKQQAVRNARDVDLDLHVPAAGAAITGETPKVFVQRP